MQHLRLSNQCAVLCAVLCCVVMCLAARRPCAARCLMLLCHVPHLVAVLGCISVTAPLTPLAGFEIKQHFYALGGYSPVYDPFLFVYATT